MPSAFHAAGVQPTKPTRYAALSTLSFFSGLNTQRSPLRDGVTPQLYSQLYGTQRYDCIIDGENTEVTNRLTLARRPGLSVYNSQTFSAINRFYSFRVFGTASTAIKVLADCADGVYDATGPSTKHLLFPKTTEQTSFQAVGNVLFFGTGKETKKWVLSTLPWTATTAWKAGQYIVDPNGNIQVASDGTSGSSQPFWATTLGATTSDGTVTWKCRGSAVQNWGIAKPTTTPVAVNTPAPMPYQNWAANTFYSPSFALVDSNNNVQKLQTSGTTGASEPTWATGLGATTTDGTVTWVNKGTANWQPTHVYAEGDLAAITFTSEVVINTQRWTGSELVDEPQTIIVSHTKLFKCTTPGTSGGSHPVWVDGTGLTVADGTMVWTNVGDVTHWSDIGATQAVSLSSVVLDPNGNKQEVTKPGKSSAGPTWKTVQGEVTIDGTTDPVLWVNRGPYSAAGTGAVQYCYAFKNSVTGHVSTASVVSSPITLAANSLILVQGNGSNDPQVDTIQIYRTAPGGSTYLLLAEIDNPGGGVTWTYTDTTASSDTSLNAFIQAQIANSNDPPPSGLTALNYHQGRMWGAVGNVVYASGGPDTTNGRGDEAFPPANVFTFPSAVVRLQPFTQGLLVFTNSSVYVIIGQGAITNFYAVPFLKGYGLLSYDAFDANGSIYYFLTSDKQLLTFDPSSGISDVGFPIGNIFASWNPANAYVTWHASGSVDKACYVADGSEGWYRLNPTPAPETGLTWSPKAKIVGGCKAVQSIETSPGVHQLLVGPDDSGPILVRDLSVFSDNGETYAAWATMGSITLASHGQMAGVQFIAVDSPKIGSAPTIGILLDEISGTFDPLTQFISDPPQLAPSDTLYGLRYYLSQTQHPALCRHMQVKVSWPAENAASELFTYSIFGTVYSES